jgi:biotin-dependent carboxylase-like uncharacterized protein
MDAPVQVGAGSLLEVGMPWEGVRTYVAVRGGLAVTPVLGSCATDLLSHLGPPVLQDGDRLPVGPASGVVPGVDVAPTRPLATEPVLRVTPGPRVDWFSAAALAALTSSRFEVTAQSDRVGVRLGGPVLERARSDELASEGIVEGAVQVPPDGQPVIFLADHPVTGGYPVIAVLHPDDVPVAAQCRPGQRVRFALGPSPI